MADNWNQGFSMPMIRSFVPERLRPWIYAYMAFTFQLTCGVYLGCMDEMRGTLDMKREDVMMCLYATLCGLALYFPLLFRTKFRFTNRNLLLFASLGIAVLSIAAMYVRLLPILWIICFLIGALKLQGTFECLSNIQLWMTPKRDFGVFFPLLHIFIMGSLCLSDVLAVYLSYYATWHYMSYLMIGIMLLDALIVMIIVKPIRLMPKTPMLAIDWLGALLWALVVMQIAFIFCYGEYYDWWKSEVIRTVAMTAVITLTLALVRMMTIHHAYVEPKIFLSHNLTKFLLLALVVETVMATEHVLESMFYAAGPQWGDMQRSILNLPVVMGVLAAVGFTLLWLKVLRWRAIRLIAIGTLVFAIYSLWFYFNISSELNIEKLYFPLFLRGFATTMMAITMLYMIKSVVHFMVFFQALSVFQCLHLVLGGVIGVAIYSFGIRYFMGDGLSHYAGAFDATSFSFASQGDRVEGVMRALRLSTVKQLYGIVAYVALTIFMLVLLWDIPAVRGFKERIPKWSSIFKSLKRRVGV